MSVAEEGMDAFVQNTTQNTKQGHQDTLLGCKVGSSSPKAQGL